MRNLVQFLRIIRFSHTFFALPFALLAAFLAGPDGAGGWPGIGPLALIVACMVFARSAAMAFNRLVDRNLDARNPRTAGRELVTGQISPRVAWLFFGACCLGFVAMCSLFWLGYGNPWPLVLAGPVLAFICLYSFTKRFTALSHFWLGASLMLAPVATWIALSPPEGPVLALGPVLLGVAVLLWVAGFDIIYACQDVAVDRREGLYSLPARLGPGMALWVSRLCHSLAVTAWLATGLAVAELTEVYLAGVITAAVLLAGAHVLVAIGRVKWAFDLNLLVGVVVAGAGIADLL